MARTRHAVRRKFTVGSAPLPKRAQDEAVERRGREKTKRRTTGRSECQPFGAGARRSFAAKKTFSMFTIGECKWMVVRSSVSINKAPWTWIHD